MINKKIYNIVFYKYLDEEGEKTQACIFYKDGSVSLVSTEEGKKACEQVLKERNITSNKYFKQMINRELIYVMSSRELRDNFSKFISYEPLNNETLDDILNEKIEDTEATEEKVEDIDELVNNNNDESNEEEKEAIEDGEDETSYIYGLDYDNSYDTDDIKFNYTNDNIDQFEVITKDNQPKKVSYTNKKEKKGILGIIQNGIEKIKKSKIATKITAVAVTLGVALGLYSCTTRKTAIGQMLNSNLTPMERLFNPDELKDSLADAKKDAKGETSVAKTAVENTQSETKTNKNNNSKFDGKSYYQLLEVTNNSTQKEAMENAFNALETFNEKFANSYVEEGKDIRPALTFEEVSALQVAYNNYSKEELLAIFNGSEIDASEFSRAYKDASLQLMGAYAIETSANPVDMSMLIESEEGKAFYHRYHQMFLEIKDATGKEKEAKIKAFSDAIKKDFPITDEVRTEGIAHADAYKSVMEGKGGAGPAVAQMVAAFEMMYQNYGNDHSLTDEDIRFLNDIGLCNYVDEKFERLETILLGSCKADETNPTYEQYKEAIIKKMIERGIYVIDDAHRELTKLDAFQNAVNWHFKADGEWVYSGGFYETTESYTVTNSWSETHTTYREEETRTQKEMPQEQKDKIDKEIEKENKKRKEKAEKEAKKNQERMQKEEDKKTKELKEEIKQEEKDLQDKIDNANDQINKNHDSDPSNDKAVNERDLGHGVDFDENHSDSQGNLDNSVENITTDPTGDQTGKELPDPNETGAKFDEKAPQVEATSSQVQERVVEEPQTTYEEPQTTYEEPQVTYEEPVVYEGESFDDGSGYYEEIVNEYVESLANEDSNEAEAAKEYTL